MHERYRHTDTLPSLVCSKKRTFVLPSSFVLQNIREMLNVARTSLMLAGCSAQGQANVQHVTGPINV